MAQREYQQLGCADLGLNCGFLVRAEKEDEVMRVFADHTCRTHGVCESDPELKGKMQGSLKSMCCEGGCYQAPKMTGQLCWDAF